jgi:hypothetical protein
VGLSLVLLGKRILIDLPAGITKLSALLEALVQGFYNRNPNEPEWITVQGVAVLDIVLGNIQLRLLINVLMTMLNGVLFFMIGSLWGSRTAGRGFALGSLACLLLVSLGFGGRAALTAPGNPREYWFRDAVTDDVFELRATLEEMSLRNTGEPRLMPITANVPDDGALAWALRDYPNTVFVDGIGPEVSSAAVIAPAAVAQTPMGADYVGKDLITRQAWDIGTLSWRDWLMWLYRGDTLIKPLPSELIRLWVRKDVYGVDFVTGE